jgi:DNA-binding beta-propeller fold protein YncE
VCLHVLYIRLDRGVNKMEIVEDVFAGVASVLLPEGFVAEEILEVVVDNSISSLVGDISGTTRELSTVETAATTLGLSAATGGIGVLVGTKFGNSPAAGRVYDPNANKNAVIVYDPKLPGKTGNAPADPSGRARRALEAGVGWTFGSSRRKKKKKKNRVYMC